MLFSCHLSNSNKLTIHLGILWAVSVEVRRSVRIQSLVTIQSHCMELRPWKIFPTSLHRMTKRPTVRKMSFREGPPKTSSAKEVVPLQYDHYITSSKIMMESHLFPLDIIRIFIEPSTQAKVGQFYEVTLIKQNIPCSQITVNYLEYFR